MAPVGCLWQRKWVHSPRCDDAWNRTCRSECDVKLDSHVDPSLKGYKIYHGTASGSYQPPIEAGLNTTVPITNLQRGIRYFFAITAYTSAGDSTYSNEVSAVIPKAISVA